MAATKRNAMTQAALRERIKGQQLVDVLQEQIDKTKKKVTPLTEIQVRIALGLLRKILPDLQTMKVEGGDPANPVHLNIINKPVNPKRKRE